MSSEKGAAINDWKKTITMIKLNQSHELKRSSISSNIAPSSRACLITESSNPDLLMNIAGKLDFIPYKMGKWWGNNPYIKGQDDVDILLVDLFIFYITQYLHSHF